MKKQTLYRIVLSVLFLFCGKLPASAHSLEQLMTVQVPFDFQVNGKSLPAGKYVIQRDPQTPGVLMIQCPERKITVIVQVIPNDLSNERVQPGLTFHGYGERRFLSEVKVAWRGVRYVLIRSKAERRLARLAEAGTTRATLNGATND